MYSALFCDYYLSSTDISINNSRKLLSKLVAPVGIIFQPATTGCNPCRLCRKIICQEKKCQKRIQNPVNETRMEEIGALLKTFIEIKGWLLLTFFICLQNQLSCFNSIIVQMSEKRDLSNRQ